MLIDIVEIIQDDLLDPEFAAGMLTGILNEDGGDFEAFLVALRDLTKVQGGMALLAEKTGLSRESLYKTLSPRGNPEFKTILRILRALGQQICFAPAGKDLEKIVEAIEAVETDTSVTAGEPGASEEPPIETLEAVKA